MLANLTDLTEIGSNLWPLGALILAWSVMHPVKRRRVFAHARELTWAVVRPVYSPPALLVWFLAPVLWATGETNELTNQLVLAGVGLPLGLWLWWRGKGCFFEGRDDYLAVTVFLAMWAVALRAMAYGANL